ncbi:MAG: DNA-directed RNA polymerase subunit alpha [bacterium]|nr:DNA-directed RNA polymerase subunit alpha [bacterium]
MIEPIFKLTTQIKEGSYARFVIEPLVKGYGYTLGNALRRVLISSLEGFAVTHVEIANVSHPFTTITGLKENVVQFLLNVKKIRIKSTIDTPAYIYLDVKGPKTVTAKDLQPESGLQITNPDLVLCHLTDKKARLKVKFTVNRGYRYVLAEELERTHLGVIPVDAVFTPVIKVNYKVEATRVGRETDWDKLILDVTTDGTIEPEEAVKQAAQVLNNHFQHLVSPQPAKDAPASAQPSLADQPSSDSQAASIEELNLPVRVINALKKANIATIQDLSKMSRKDLASIKNLGQKSIDMVIESLKKINLTLE